MSRQFILQIGHLHEVHFRDLRNMAFWETAKNEVKTPCKKVLYSAKPCFVPISTYDRKK